MPVTDLCLRKLLMSSVNALRCPLAANGSAATHRCTTERCQDVRAASERPAAGEAASSEDLVQRECDQAIEALLKGELRKSSYHAVRQVSCDVSHGAVSLSGRVPSFYLKQVAQTIVSDLLAGSLVISNQVEVVRRNATTVSRRKGSSPR